MNGIDTLFAHYKGTPETIGKVEKIQGIFTRAGNEIGEILGVTDVTKLEPNTDAYWAYMWLKNASACFNTAVLADNGVGYGGRAANA